MTLANKRNILRPGTPTIIDGSRLVLNQTELAQLQRESLKQYGISFDKLNPEQKMIIENGWFDIPGQRTT